MIVEAMCPIIRGVINIGGETKKKESTIKLMVVNENGRFSV